MRDNVKPGEKWEFNEDVAACFANMLERSMGVLLEAIFPIRRSARTEATHSPSLWPVEAFYRPP